MLSASFGYCRRPHVGDPAFEKQLRIDAPGAPAFFIRSSAQHRGQADQRIPCGVWTRRKQDRFLGHLSVKRMKWHFRGVR